MKRIAATIVTALVLGALIPSLSTQAQPSGREVQELVGQIRSEGVKAIFPESA